MGYGVIVLVYRWSVEIGDNRLGLYMVCGRGSDGEGMCKEGERK